VWVSQEGKRCKLGLGDYLQQKSGDVAYVELATAVGQQVEVGDVLANIETMKTSFDLESPLAGLITQANPEISDRPERVNEDPYGAGWLLEIEIPELPVDLLDAPSYLAVMSAEAAEEAAKLGR
jgi:glycine cleavage system H protein